LQPRAANFQPVEAGNRYLLRHRNPLRLTLQQHADRQIVIGTKIASISGCDCCICRNICRPSATEEMVRGAM
jgi:hypothetical protein